MGPVLEANGISVVIMFASLVFIILMITKAKINPVYAMLVGAITAGVLFGLPLEGAQGVLQTVIGGFGTTIGNIGIVILLGCTIGVILEDTGGAIVLANTILKAVGQKRAALAMMISGYLISIPVFSDTAIVILTPVARTVTRRSGVPLIATLGALNAGIMATHTIVPPTPGPLAAAGTLGADLGIMIALGMIVALVYGIFALVYVSSPFCTKRFPNTKGEEDTDDDDESDAQLGDDLTIKSDKKLPGAGMTFACLLVPLALICINSFGRLAMPDYHPMLPIMGFIGHPIMALGVGVLMCFLLDTSRFNKEQVSQWFAKTVDTSAFIILATGTAGAYGFILRASGVGEFMGQAIAGTALPAVFIPFFVTVLLVLSNGSATVSLVTGSAIMFPLMPYLGLHPVIIALALSAGASFFYHVNASHYWVVVKSAKLSMREGFFNVSGGTAIGSIGAMIAVLILSLFVHP